MGAGCFKEIVHQSDGIAKGIAGILLRWYCQLVDSPKENREMEGWENGWGKGQNGPGRDKTKTRGREMLEGMVGDFFRMGLTACLSSWATGRLV